MFPIINYRSFFNEDDTKYWGEEAAGCIFVAKDTGRILLAHRSAKVEFEPNTWATWGGKIDNGESPKDAVEREIEEETGFNGKYKISLLYVYKDGDFSYHNYLIAVPFEFQPELNWENNNAAWVEYGDWPTPLHFGLKALIEHAGNKIKNVVDLIKKRKEKMVEVADVPPAIVQPSNPSQNPTKTINQQQLKDAYVVAATLWGEARGEGIDGMQAVLNVVMNRTKGNFDKAKDAVLKPKQFSMWNNVKNPEKVSLELAQKQRGDKTYMAAIKLVDAAMKGNLPDITNGATFYYNPKKANPSWAKSMIKTKSIGNHDFLKLPSKKQIKEEIDNIEIINQGLIDDDIYGYELKSPYSYLRYGHEPSSKTYYILNIGTPKEEDKHKGYASQLLNKLFKIISDSRGNIDAGSFTTSGQDFIKPVIDRLSKQFGVRIVQGKEW
jgi:8-oxo-dGTP pyrophosphatase MutT (NUDIX family)/spore germination cell wall hydrolase CwlJ-like protein